MILMDEITRTREAHESAKNRFDAVRLELAELGRKAENDTLTEGEGQRLDRQIAAHDKLQAEVEQTRKAHMDAVQQGLRNGSVKTEPGDSRPTGASARASTGNGLHDEARRVIDTEFRAAGLPAEAAEKAERLVVDGPRYDRDIAARWAIATGAPEYRSAFVKLLADPTRGHLLWTAAEQEAYRAVNEWAVESRTYMSNTDAAGGYLTLPLQLDPSIHLTSSGSINPLRQLATVRQTVSDTYRTVTSAGVTAEWLATQNSQAADASPTLGNVDIPVIKGAAFVAYSFEVGQDGINFLDELTKLLNDGADQLQATAFTTGAGTTEPYGIVTGLAGTSSEINTVGSEAIAAADAFALQNALPPRFSANARWLMNIATINTFAQFETTNGALKFPEIKDGSLLRKPVHELSNLDGAIDAAATANNYTAIYGDIAETFLIADRIGTQIELIPNLVGANARPTGSRGAFLWFRTGSRVVNSAASRLLDVPTTA